MFMIKENTENEIVIKNSRFITLLYRIHSKGEVSVYLDDAKKKYTKATHYCYAYILKDYKKSSDDNEPGGTAGMPILNVLEKEEITNVLCIVVRYFGGIKLGAGGLVRAYSKSVRECIKSTELNEVTEGFLIKIKFNYEEAKQIDYLLRDSTIINKSFTENVIYEVEVKINLYNELLEKNYNIKKISDIQIKK